MTEVWYDVVIDNTNNANTLTYYQVRIDISNDSQFFSDCNNAKESIRVYDSDKATALSYWIEEWDTANNNAIIWVKVPSIPASSTKNIYISIDTSRTEDASDGTATFLFFDDFEGTTQFTEGSAVVSYVAGKDGGQAIQIDGSSAYRRRTTTTDMGRDTIFETWVKVPSDNPTSALGGIFFAAQSTEKYGFQAIIDERATVNDIQIRKNYDAPSKVTGSKTGEIQTDTWYFMKVIWKSDGTIDYTLYENGQIFDNVSTTNTSYTSGHFGIGTYDKTIFDKYRVRKYTSPEPTVSYSKEVTGEKTVKLNLNTKYMEAW